MAIQRYKVSLNQARFPFISLNQSRPVLIPAGDTAARQPRPYQGAVENMEFNIPQIIYGENFVPVASGVRSVSYRTKIAAVAGPGISVATNADQIFDLRDSDENTVLFSPGGGFNYIYDVDAPIAPQWTSKSIIEIHAAEVPPRILTGVTTLAGFSARVTRAYVEGYTFVCYSRLKSEDPPANVPPVNPKDASIYYWRTDFKTLQWVDTTPGSGGLIQNLPTVFPIGTIDGIASSNGYLLVWSGIQIAWAPFNGTDFDFEVYANGEITGAGNQIPEDIRGPITAVVPVAGGFIIFTTKNAVAAFYNANNFASPWIFKGISNAGGVEGFEQVANEGPTSAVYAYTTGGLQKITLNSAEPVFPDASDFLGGHLTESFDQDLLEFSQGEVTIEMFVKLTICGNRFLVLSYGTYPGLYFYALIYDLALERWGKLKKRHKDCFYYNYGTETADITYAMLGDLTYDEMGELTYGDMAIPGGNLTYPRQCIAFMYDSGSIDLAVMDDRTVTGPSQAFIVIGKNQLSRSRFSTLHEIEIDGLQPGGEVVVWRSINGRTPEAADAGVLREQTGDYAEYGFDLVTGKNFTVMVKGHFSIEAVVLHASNDGAI